MKLEAIKQFPHCDAAVLHAPGECEYCDKHKDWQELREVWGVNFTGKSEPHKLPCPAEVRRSVDKINAWPGNRPMNQAEKTTQELYWEKWKKDTAAQVGLNMPIAPDPPSTEDIAAKHPETGKVTRTGEVKVTLSGKPPCPEYDGPAPCPIEPETGMHQDYWVLAPEERAKGFVRPLRRSYQHVGVPGPQNALRDLTAEEHERYDQFDYFKFEEYPRDEKYEHTSINGRYWTQKELDNIGKGCGAVTTMNEAIAETYARNPRFYGGTFCSACRNHFPVGEYGEFVWDGTNNRVGT